MFYIVEVDHTKILMQVGAILNPDTIFSVSTKIVDGVEKYFVKDKHNIQLIIPSECNVIFPSTEEEQKAFKTLYEEMGKDRDEYRSRAWKAEEELKKCSELRNLKEEELDA